MDCYICGKESKGGDKMGDSIYVDCPACGEYKIAGTVMAVASNKTINVEYMQSYLKSERDQGTRVPLLGSYDMKYL